MEFWSFARGSRDLNLQAVSPVWAQVSKTHLGRGEFRFLQLTEGGMKNESQEGIDGREDLGF